MSALAQTSATSRGIASGDVDTLVAIEAGSYAFPWSRGNFIDSLAAGYLCQLLVEARGTIVGYFIAMRGVGEMHLLNITVAPEWQHRGLAQQMLDELESVCRAEQLPLLWLEVRLSNQRARDIYRRRGFAEVGLRRGYYPGAQNEREDAVVMRAALQSGDGHGLG